jgi:hypothetical protein
VKWGTEKILVVSRYDLYNTFKDLWLTKEERDDKVFEGVQSENLRKLRSGLTVAGASASHNALNKVFSKKYKIPLDFESLTTHAPFYKFPREDIIFELTLARKENIIVTNTTANMNYKLENICLEYNTVTSETLARQMQNNYNAGFVLHFDCIDFFKETSISANDTLINENVNFPKRSIKCILLLFISNFDDGEKRF